MKFDTPATTNPIDQLKVVGKPVDRIDGPLRPPAPRPMPTSGTMSCRTQAYGYVVGSAIAKGRIASIDLRGRKAAPGVLAIVTARECRQARQGQASTPPSCSAGPRSSTTTRRSRSSSPRPSSRRARPRSWSASTTRAAKGAFDLAAAKDTAQAAASAGGPADTAVGDFAGAFAAAPVQLDATYTTPDQAHAMMEPHASIAAWNGDKLTLWTSNQMIDWSVGDMAKTLGIPKEKVRLISPFIGGGFGGKLFAARRRAARRARRARGRTAGEGGAARGR